MNIIEKIKAWLSNILRSIKHLNESDSKVEPIEEKNISYIVPIERKDDDFDYELEKIERLEKQIKSVDSEIKEKRGYLSEILTQIERIETQFK